MESSERQWNKSNWKKSFLSDIGTSFQKGSDCVPGAVSSTASNYGDCSCIHCKATKIQLFGGSKKALTLHFVFSSSLCFWRRRKNFGNSNIWEIMHPIWVWIWNWQKWHAVKSTQKCKDWISKLQRTLVASYQQRY